MSSKSPKKYGEEGLSFEEFELKVKRLCQFVWPTPTTLPEKASTKRKQKRFAKAQRKRDLPLPQSEYKPKEFIIEPMRGGGFNDVVGIKIVGQENHIEAQMVLRVRQKGKRHSDQDVTNLQFVQEFLDLPTAEIIAYDFSSSNPLSSPFILQRRIPGYDLTTKPQSYGDLSQKQRLVFVENFCSHLSSLKSVQFPWIGQIKKENAGYTVSPFESPWYEDSWQEDLVERRAECLPFFKVRPIGLAELTSPHHRKSGDHDQSVLRFLLTQFGRHRQNWIDKWDPFNPAAQWCTQSLWFRLATASQQMDELACLDSDYNSLAHYDLYPRNIMVEIKDEIPKISGIIDWDMACFAPDWVSCEPPTWIWDWDNDDEPPTAEQRELKDLFDKLVGPDFRRKAYEPHYRLARDMFRFAKEGIFSDEWKLEAEDVLEEWEVMYKEKLAERKKRVRSTDGLTRFQTACYPPLL